jgi:hypothetical protein
MMPQEVLNYVKAQPFRPFRIRMNSGRMFDRMKTSQRIISTILSDSPEEARELEQGVSLLLIESIESLDATTQPQSR